MYECCKYTGGVALDTHLATVLNNSDFSGSAWNVN